MSQKHKRTITENLTETEINNTLSTVKNMLESLEPKQQHIMAEWIDVWCKYIGFEKRFQPQRLRYYKRGEIVLAHFGYNVGSELGGIHFAVIVEIIITILTTLLLLFRCHLLKREKAKMIYINPKYIWVLFCLVIKSAMLCLCK